MYAAREVLVHLRVKVRPVRPKASPWRAQAVANRQHAARAISTCAKKRAARMWRAMRERGRQLATLGGLQNRRATTRNVGKRWRVESGRRGEGKRRGSRTEGKVKGEKGWQKGKATRLDAIT